LLQAKTPTLDQGIWLWDVFDPIGSAANLFTRSPSVVSHQAPCIPHRQSPF